MNLNLHILREDLPQLNLKGKLYSDAYLANCNYPIIFDDPDLIASLQENILYIVPAHFLQSGQFSQCSLSVLSVGKPEDSWIESGIDLLYTEESLSCTQVLMMIAERFYYYSQWEQSLQQVIDAQAPLRRMAQLSENIFNNPIGIECDSFLQLLSYMPEAYAQTDVAKEYCNGYPMPVKADNVYMEMKWQDFLVQMTEYDTGDGLSKPLTVLHGIGSFPKSIYCNYRKADRLVCRVYLDECFTPISDKHMLLLRVFTKYIAKYLGDTYILQSNQPHYLEAVANAFMRKDVVSDVYIRSILETLEWNETGTFFFIILQPGSAKGRTTGKNMQTVLGIWAQKIAAELNSYCFYYTSTDLRFIINIDMMALSLERIQQFFQAFAKENNAAIGMSNSFHEFRSMRPYCLQAEFALQSGHETALYSFDQFYYEYWKKNVLMPSDTVIESESLIPEGLKELRKYDVRKHTDFTGLLRIYLENERSITKTIKQAYLHRNTFLYQIEKIKSILNMDLDDPKVRLVLLMAYEIDTNRINETDEK